MGRKGVKPGQVLTDALTDLVFRWPARRFAEAHRGRTHMYEFDWRSPAFGGELGAAHGMEMPFVFDTLATVTGPQGLAGEAPPQDLATRIHRLWVGFATDGSLPWPEFDAETRQVYSLVAGEARHEPVMPAAPFLP
jgi:para-nitrobenzyl esterase